MKKIIILITIALLVAAPAFAGETRTWEEIKDGIVRAFHSRSDDRVPVFHPQSGLTLVEVTSAEPMPAQKWKYDSKTGEFFEPDPPDPQIAIGSKITTEMQSAKSRAAAIVRLKRAGALPAEYTEAAIE